MTTSSNGTQVLEILLDFLKTTDMAARSVEADDELLASGLLDSLKILNLVTFVEQEFETQVPMEDVLPENFGSPRAISLYLSQRPNV